MQDYLDKRLVELKEIYGRERRVPPYSVLGEIWKVSKVAVMKTMHKLGEAGFLQQEARDGRWVPTARFFERAVAPTHIPAGMPVEHVQAGSDDAFVVDQYLVDDPNNTVMMVVRGDSMIDAGIQDGDMAVIEKRNYAKEGNIVAAYVDGNLTLKKLARMQGEYVLIPCNKMYPVIKPERTLEIYGVLAGIVRKYKH